MIKSPLKKKKFIPLERWICNFLTPSKRIIHLKHQEKKLRYLFMYLI